MKFICPICKTKYTIADEKVAGRALRMKCRKCGNLVQIKPMTDAEAAAAGPSEPPPKLESLVPPAEVKRPSLKPPIPARTPRAPTAQAAPAKTSVGALGKPLAAAGVATGPRRAQLPRPPSAANAAPARPAPSPAAPLAKSDLGAAAPPKPLAVVAPVKSSPPLDPVARPAAVAELPKAPAVPTFAAVSPAAADAAQAPSALAGVFPAAVTAPSEPPPEPAPGGGDWYVGVNGAPLGPVALNVLRAKAAEGAVTAESLVWKDGFEQWQPLRNFPELSLIVEESVSSARAAAAPLPPPIVAPSAPAQLAEPAIAEARLAPTPTTGPGVVSDKLDLELAGLAPRRGASPAAWIAVVVALLFGLTIGFVVFGGQKPAEPVIKYVEVPAKTTPAAAEPIPAPTEAPPSPEPAAPGDSKAAARPAGQKAAPAKAEPGKPIEGLKGLAGLQGDAPRSGPTGTETTASQAGQPLDSAAVQSTVSRYTSSVKRSCWQPALDTRDQDAPTSARVSVAITVGPSGSVQNVTTSGDPKGYRGLASCIAGRVRGWQFPASNGTTTVNVPFVFAAQ